MIVIVLTAVPPRLRGVLTRWLLEIAPGVFVGRTSARVRDLMWARIVDDIGRGRAIMVHSQRSEQHLDFRVHGHDWIPTDFDGLHLMMRPDRKTPPEATKSVEATGPKAWTSRPPRMWSHAERRLRQRRRGGTG